METTRRHFLRGAAAASALAAAPVAVAAGQQETAELLALGKEFDIALALHIKATDRVAELQQAFWALAPSIPANISGSQYARFFGWEYGELLRNPACPRFSDMRTAKNERIVIIKAYHLEREFEGKEMPPALKRLYPIVLDYERATDSALHDSGMAAALEEYNRTDGALRHVVNRLVNVRARTTAGLALKIRATGAYAALGSEERLSASLWLAKSMWSDLEEGEAGL